MKSYVYFIKPIGLDGPIKIGCAYVPQKRLMALAMWSPFPLELIGSVQGTLKDEAFLHRCFTNDHSHHEWFQVTEELRNAIDMALKAGTIDVLRSILKAKENIRSPAPTRKRDADYCLRMSYVHRLRHVKNMLNGGILVREWDAPKQVHEIMDAWEPPFRQKPSIEDFEILNRYLDNPKSHCVRPAWWKEAS